MGGTDNWDGPRNLNFVRMRRFCATIILLIAMFAGFITPAAGAVAGLGRSSLAAKTPLSVPAAGEDLFVGLYGQSRRANIQSGLNATHTPHHVVQNAVSDTSHSLGVTINMRKDLHALTRSYGRNADLGNNVSNLAADVWDMRSIFRGAGYDRSLVNQQMRALIDLNRKVGNVP
jgi:hypothetical protein